jgi:hypothetical protein
MPLDDVVDAAEAQRDTGYGRVVIHGGAATRETRSTSRKEIVTLVFEAAGRPLPDWNQPTYPGFPVVVTGARRLGLVVLAYVLVPLGLLVLGLNLSRRRTQR